MRILYYLEPYAELGKPLFRLATVRSHLDRETQRLLEYRALGAQIGMLCSHHVASAVRREGLLANVQLFTLTQAELRSVYPDYLEASSRWYNRDFASSELSRMVELCRKSLGGFEPDVIVCCESNAPFLETLFPRALILHNSLGIFSRSPYPETSALDPFGVGKDAFLRKFAARIRDVQLDENERARLERLKQSYQLAQLEHSPLHAAHVRGKFERVVLLPLQVSQYFMFDENCPVDLRGGSQLDFVRYVLTRVDPAIGVYVTLHTGDEALFTGEAIAELRARFPNFLFSEQVQRMRWVSQHVLPHVDAVVTVSSSVGLQAMVWDLPVVALGRSHVTGVAASEALEDLPSLLQQGRTKRMDGALYYLLTHYYPLMDAYHHRGEWFGKFLERGIREQQRGLDFDFFAPIDDPDTVVDALIDGLRPGVYQSELRLSLRQGGPAVRIPTDDIERAIAGAEVVSFQVFDTLVSRPLTDPCAVFDLAAARAQALFDSHQIDVAALGGFRRLREEHGRAAAREPKADESERYDLLRVYEAMCARVGAPPALAVALKQIEESVELAINRPRQAGKRAYEQAVARGKRIVLVADSILDREVVESVLERCGYSAYAQLYVSSDYNAPNPKGGLIARVRELEKQPAAWVHLGHDRLSDVQIPSRMGVHAYLLPSISELYAEAPHVHEIWKTEELDKTVGAALLHGVVSRKFYDKNEHEPRFEGSPYRLGYEAGGPLMLAFVSFLIERSQRDKITDLYFLSRDGHLPKQIYDLVSRSIPDAARAHYLYASRRAYSVAALANSRDITRSLEIKNSTLRLSQLLASRFGVAPNAIVPGSLEAAGFGSIEDAVTLSDGKQRAQLEQFLRLNSEVILAQARDERSSLIEYLRSEGLYDEARRVATVDIGHHASLQLALSQLTGRTDLSGYYFSTFYPAHKVFRSGLDIRSYLLEFEESSSSHVYCRNVGMFEFLFLPALPSLMRMARDDSGTLQPVFVPGDESKRFKLIEEVHRGVIDFCRDVVDASAGQPWLFEVSKNDAIRTFARFVAKPSRVDAKLLDGVSFVDAFGGTPVRYLIASPFLDAVGTANMAAYLKESWWKAGAQAVLDEAAAPTAAPSQPTGPPSAASAKPSAATKPTNGGPSKGAVAEMSSKQQWERKLQKFLRDPQAFALDTKVAKSVRKILRGPRRSK